GRKRAPRSGRRPLRLRGGCASSTPWRAALEQAAAAEQPAAGAAEPESEPEAAAVEIDVDLEAADVEPHVHIEAAGIEAGADGRAGIEARDARGGVEPRVE